MNARSKGSRLSLFQAVLEHMEWADVEVLESLERAGPGQREAIELFAHVLGTEDRWLSRLTGEDPRVPVWPDADLTGCRALAADLAVRYRSYVGRLDEARLDRQVAYVNSAGQAFRSTVRDVLLHVFLHGAYHRGQVARALRQAGAIPSPTDYIAFARGAPAATRVDAEPREDDA